MKKTDVIYNLAEILGCDARKDEPMSKHTTFKIGGSADTYIKVANPSKLCAIIKECKSSGVDYFILGNGSNLLVSDDGYRGVAVRLDGEFRRISLIDENTIFCGAGASLAYLCKFAKNCCLTGLEFAWGIPGTVGGAVYMNAGAYGGEMKDVVHCVTHISPDGKLGRLEGEELCFGYRTSAYKSNNMIITGVTFKLKKGNPDDIQSLMDDYLCRRNTKQPLEYPSAGSVFKRPEGYFAGALIEECGLKGKCVGGAQVSEKHAGFIINRSNAKAIDVKQLIKEIQDKVKSEKGVDLQCEIIMI